MFYMADYLQKGKYLKYYKIEYDNDEKMGSGKHGRISDSESELESKIVTFIPKFIFMNPRNIQ